jgi:hypothetical protein
MVVWSRLVIEFAVIEIAAESKKKYGREIYFAPTLIFEI